MQPCNHDGLNRSSCINWLSCGRGRKRRNKSPPPWPRTVKRLWHCVLRRAEIIQGVEKKKNLLAEVINRKLSIRIHKAPTNLWEWHQFPKGQPPHPYLLLNTTESCIYRVRALMKDGFRSASLLLLTVWRFVESRRTSSYWLRIRTSYNCSEDVHL